MKDLSPDRLLRDRKSLIRTLNAVRSGNTAGLLQDEVRPIQEALKLRIENIDRQLRSSARSRVAQNGV
jgi:hypothetical protein